MSVLAVVPAEMSASDLAAVLVSVAVAVAVGLLVWAIGSLLRAARRLRTAAEHLDAEATALVHELRVAVANTEAEVDRIDAVLASAESITGTVDAASKLAYRAVSNPVIKTMALASGTSRAAKRLRGVEAAPPSTVTALTPAPGTSQRRTSQRRKRK